MILTMKDMHNCKYNVHQVNKQWLHWMVNRFAPESFSKNVCKVVFYHITFLFCIMLSLLEQLAITVANSRQKHACGVSLAHTRRKSDPIFGTFFIVILRFSVIFYCFFAFFHFLDWNGSGALQMECCHLVNIYGHLIRE